MSFSSFSRTLRARLHLGSVPPAVYGGIIVAVIVAVAFAVSSVVSQLGSHAFEIDTEQAAASEDAGGDDGADSSEPATLFVHIAGAVNAPGLYELAQGSRVADAVNAAGGLSESASTDAVNLARVLNDGEQILIPDREELESQSASAPSADASAPAAAAATGSLGLININTASAEELETLDGVGPATAEKIVRDRTENGPFQTVDDLTRVSGIGEKKLAAMRDHICV